MGPSSRRRPEWPAPTSRASTRRCASRPEPTRRACFAPASTGSASAGSRSSLPRCTTSSSKRSEERPRPRGAREATVHKVLMVIRREYLERVRKKSFWIGTLIFPLLTVLLFVGPILLVRATPEVQRKVLLVDATGKLLAPLQKELADEKLKNGKPKFVVEGVPMKGTLQDTEKGLEPRVSSDESFAILTAGEKLDADDNYQVYLKNTGNVITLNDLQRAVHSAVVGVRMEDMKIGVDRATLDKVTARIDLQSNQITAGGQAKKKSFISTYMGTFIFVFVLFMSMLLYGVAMMRGILEEKSNRIMEVLLGSLTPDQLMTGKILGIGLVGLTQLSIYMVTVVPLRLWLGTMARSGSSDSDFDI